MCDLVSVSARFNWFDGLLKTGKTAAAAAARWNSPSDAELGHVSVSHICPEL